ncbi:MAG: aminotransferase class I/II-fold pyridoxal phosphate-dependent enzyme [Pseudomonadota bacterium]
MTVLNRRAWVPEACESYMQAVAQSTSQSTSDHIADRIGELTDWNRTIHEKDCFNLNPAANVMNPAAEAVLAAGLGSRPSLGYPGDKYEMGLEAIQEIEVIAAQLAAEIFQACHVEIRVASGAMANLYAFMATCCPGDPVIVPPATIGGHVTHRGNGCAGLFGLDIHEAPIDGDGYSVDLDALADLARRVRPKLITIGGSLNLFPHPVPQIREIADSVGAKVLFDAAHLCGVIAGGAWPNPLQEGAHLMTMSTYKSLGGPAGGLLVSNDAAISERLDKIAFPGMTANFDAAKSAALALTLLDWREFGAAYAQEMVRVAKTFAYCLSSLGVPVFAKARDFTQSHQFAVEAAGYGGGQCAAKALRKAGFLTCGIGLPLPPVDGDMNGLRIGTPEIVRWGVTARSIEPIAVLLAKALGSDDPSAHFEKVSALRQQYDRLCFMRDT